MQLVEIEGPKTGQKLTRRLLGEKVSEKLHITIWLLLTHNQKNSAICFSTSFLNCIFDQLFSANCF